MDPSGMDPDQRRAVADALYERAERILERIEERYGPAPRREPAHHVAPEYAPETFPPSVDAQLERIAGIAGVLVTDEDDRVLVVDVTYNDVDWQTPGGAVEPGDSLPETARKETREETGLEITIDGLLYTRRAEVEYDPTVAETPTIPMAVFTGRPIGGRLESGGNVLPDGRDEIADVAWFAPERLPEGTLDREWILAHVGGERSPRSTDSV